MNREEIKNRLDKRNFNTETISLLLNAIDDIELVCSKYISTDEVVDRICDILSSDVEYDNLRKDGALGRFSSSSKKIILDKSLKDNPELQASVFFHELIHCITFDKENLRCGFHFIYQFSDEDEYEEEGRGFNEGITQYLTKKRNELRGVNIELAYPILTMEVENIISIIGEDDMFNSLFHNPHSIKDVFQKHKMSYRSIIFPLDIIHSNEYEIQKLKFLSPNQIVMYSNLFGKSTNSLIYEKMGVEAQKINQQFLNALGNIDSIEAFKNAVNFIVKLKSQNYGLDKNQINIFLSFNIKNLIDLGFDKNEIDKILDENGLKNELEMHNQLTSLMTDDKNTTLLNIYKLTQDPKTFDLFNFIFDTESIEALIKRYFFPNQIIDSSNLFIIILGQFIQQYPEYDLDEICLESFYSELIESKFFSIIHTSDGKKFIMIDKKELREIAASEEEYMRSISTPVSPSIDSNLDFLKNRLVAKQKTLDNMISINASPVVQDNLNQIIKNYQESIAEIEARISERRNKSKKTAHSNEDFNPTGVDR